jgi:hypothetical protein
VHADVDDVSRLDLGEGVFEGQAGIEPAGAQERTPLVVENRNWQPRAVGAGEGRAAPDAALPLPSSSE